MIDFVIVEDDLYYLHKYKKIIDKVMMNYDIEYQIIIFDNATSLINNFQKNDVFKIYIINFEKNNKTLKMLKEIRENQDDWRSLIIIIFNDIMDKTTVYEKKMFIVDYVDKNDLIEKTLTRNIQICLKNYEQRPNSLKYYYKKTFYNIEFQKILYIEKEQESKRSIIKTNENEYYIQDCLNRLESKLDKRFIKCNRSYIINMEQVEYYNKKDNIISFKNGQKIMIVLRDKKKEIMNYLREISLKK